MYVERVLSPHLLLVLDIILKSPSFLYKSLKMKKTNRHFAPAAVTSNQMKKES